MRILLILLAAISGALYVYDVWLYPVLSEVPDHVWSLSAWSWVCWAGWWTLLRLSR